MSRPNVEHLGYFVMSVRTGHIVAAFMSADHARKYVKERVCEGPHRPLYEIVDRKGNIDTANFGL